MTDAIRWAGAMLSNCAFNLAQRKAGDPLTEADIRALDQSRRAWDAALGAFFSEQVRPAAATSAQWAMCPETGTPCSNCPTKRAACEAAAAPDVWVTDAMVTDYLEANDRYWLEKDAMPRSLTKWRNGTPREATRVSLIAALAAPAQGAKPVDGDALLQDGMTNADLLKAWHSKLRNIEPTDRDLTAFALGVEVGAARRTPAAAPQPPATGTKEKA